MKKGNLFKPSFIPPMSSGLKLSVTLIIVLMVISSPVLMLVNPTQVSAATISNNSNRIDSSGYHSTPSIPAAATSPLSSPTPMVPAATSQENNGNFTAQAALTLTRAAQTNNFVASKAYYDISFRTRQR
jgi:hypothetical protein